MRTIPLLVAAFPIALAVTGPTDMADLVPDGAPRAAAIEAPQEAAVKSPTGSRPVPKRIVEGIEALKAQSVDDKKRWAAIRDLVAIGKPAVPYLADELDRTTEERELRSLGFTLRAIGDPRAVPALIRAIPRTLVKAGSDYGLTINDAELLAFLQRHDLTRGEGGRLFTFGMPFREITGALHALTGQRFNEAQLNFINLSGGPAQRRLQLELFRRLAERWAGWWEENRRRFTNDPAYSRVNLPPLPEAPRRAATTSPPFPNGEKVRASTGWAGVIVGPPQPPDSYRSFKDLDTGRESRWPAGLPAPEQAKPKDIAAWAAQEGYDLRGIEYRPPGSDRSCYALQGLGIRAWQVDNGRYATIEDELRRGRPPELGRPADELLMDFDAPAGTYRPENQATFLFVTREGATGVLQVTGLVTELFGAGDIGQPVRPGGRRGFSRGVEFQYKLLYEEENVNREEP
jgi:hypothetical protein